MQLKQLWKIICKSVERIVYCVVGIVALCVVSVLIYNTYNYYSSGQYKAAITREIYDNLNIYTGQMMPPLRILNSDIQNAWTDGTSVVITTKLISILNKDQIANVLAHEMAHNMLAHTDPSSMLSPLSVIDREAHADKVGVYLMLRAGYDICQGKDAWLKFRETPPGEQADPSKTDHPGYSYRYYQESMPWCN